AVRVLLLERVAELLVLGARRLDARLALVLEVILAAQLVQKVLPRCRETRGVQEPVDRARRLVKDDAVVSGRDQHTLLLEFGAPLGRALLLKLYRQVARLAVLRVLSGHYESLVGAGTLLVKNNESARVLCLLVSKDILLLVDALVLFEQIVISAR